MDTRPTVSDDELRSLCSIQPGEGRKRRVMHGGLDRSGRSLVQASAWTRSPWPTMLAHEQS
jgi:hypothetical protein